MLVSLIKLPKKDGFIIGDYRVGEETPWAKLPWMNSIADIQHYKNLAFKKFYFRPKFILDFMIRNLRKRNWKQINFAFKNIIIKLKGYNAL